MTNDTPAPADLVEACPFCGNRLSFSSGKLNKVGRCGTDDCWMKDRKITVPLDAPHQVEQWNRRAAHNAHTASGGVVQADRERTASYYETYLKGTGEDEIGFLIREGSCDSLPLVQAFADCRRAAAGGKGAACPSLELCVQFSECGQHIRKWSRLPFDGGTDFYSHPATPRPDPRDAEIERLREALKECDAAFRVAGRDRLTGSLRKAASNVSAALAKEGK